MPIFNLTIDDTSPLIRYDTTWSDSSHADDYWSAYSNGTFHATDQYGATATLTFNGSAIYLYGAFRPNHDTYWVTLDGNVTVGNGNPNSTMNLFQHLMYSATNLPDGEHHLVLQNKYSTAGASWVDVDYMLVTSGDGNPVTQSHDTVLDDVNKSIRYSAGWDISPNDVTANYFKNTAHRTSQPNASATISFEGNSITVYGTTSMDHAAFSVELDGGTPIVLNGSAPVTRFQNMLYFAGDLSNSSHTLTIANMDTSGMWLDLDKVVISKWGSWAISGDTSHSTNGSTSTSGPSSSSPVGPIVGGVVAGVVCILIVLGLFFFYRRRHRMRGVDRIHTGAISKEDIFDGPEVTIEPFNSYHGVSTQHSPSTDLNASTIDFSERAPLGVPQASGAAPTDSWVYVPNTPSLYESNRAPPNSQPSSTQPDHTSKYVVANSHNRPPSSDFSGENPHKDFPPPNYTEATASSVRAMSDSGLNGS
ncbi:hypothetical protein BDY19DRAFT_933898 [Irpex rosettiformis]|uniref:Uncharacterized protein n=1 Tax=Irpex rosettiformis TaxID=378272 RepID=A0ACB8UAH8_9APHY|nr:hypothetical protein BDY19DRAFT_933898 [Irpex rosettiformis]